MADSCMDQIDPSSHFDWILIIFNNRKGEQADGRKDQPADGQNEWIAGWELNEWMDG